MSAISEVVSDYDGVPLILAPDFTLDDEHVLSADELRESLVDLLVPQTTMLIADSATLLQLAQPDSTAEAPTLDTAISHILAQGCELRARDGNRHASAREHAVQRGRTG